MFFQQGLGYTPLQSGLSVTPFAVGSAVSAAVAGRLVPTYGRRLTVTGLAMVAVGLLAVALLAELVPPSASGWAFALPLLFAGVGGGMVISPNTTLTLECVPVRMAGVAGGALQTGQRIGTAIGTAVLASVFGTVVGAATDYPRTSSGAETLLSAKSRCSIRVTSTERHWCYAEPPSRSYGAFTARLRLPTVAIGRPPGDGVTGTSDRGVRSSREWTHSVTFRPVGVGVRGGPSGTRGRAAHRHRPARDGGGRARVRGNRARPPHFVSRPSLPHRSCWDGRRPSEADPGSPDDRPAVARAGLVPADALPRPG
jgi:hypothetical protein